MKTRIISGVIMGLILIAVLTAGFLWNPIVIIAVVGLLASAAMYELLHNAIGIEDKVSWIGACVYAFLSVLSLQIGGYALLALVCWFIVTALYTVFASVLILKNHKTFNLTQIFSLFALPLSYSLAFLSLGGIIISKSGIYYLLQLLNFSCICDMGAYFVGVTLGKHKLCPEISPKKTVEGAIGGILSSIIISFVLCICFKKNIIAGVALTIPFCVLSMIGDLFASTIKRSVGIKDYSDLIPGHGGIMDRLDSMIMIAPLMYILTLFSVM